MSLTFINMTKGPTQINLGSSLGLWDVCRNKIILHPTFLIYSKQSQNKGLKNLLEKTLTNTIDKQINKIQKFLTDNGFTVPTEPNWQLKRRDESPMVISKTILDDEEIAMSLRELVRLTITLDTEALRNAVNIDARNILHEIFSDDNELYTQIISIQEKNKWGDFPLYLSPYKQ